MKNLQQFYKKLRDAQINIVSEITYFRTVGGHTIKRELSNEILRQFLVDLKTYYTTQTLFSIFKDQKEKFPSAFFENFDDRLNDLSSIRYDLPACEKLKDFDFSHFKRNQLRSEIESLELTDMQRIDIITYSIIPSKFRFFISNQATLDEFISFIRDLPNNKRLLMSRSIFVQPEIINFTSSVFYEIFEPYFYDERLIQTIDNQDISTKIIKNFQKNVYLFPETIKYFLWKVGDQKNVFFFNNYLKEVAEAPERYLIFPAWHPYTFEYFQQFLNILHTILYNQDFQKAALNILMNGFLQEKAIFRFIPKPFILENFIISNIDVSNYSQEKDFPDQFNLFFHKELNEDNRNQSNSETLIFSNIPESLLRKLLKEAPLLPENCCFSQNNYQALDIIKKFLVESCNPLKRTNAEYIYQSLEKIIHGYDQKRLNNLIDLSKNLNDHNKERQKYQDDCHMKEIINKLILDISNFNSKASNLLRLIYLRNNHIIEKANDFLALNTFNVYDVQQFKNKFSEFMNQIKTIILPDKTSKYERLLYHIFSKNLTFQNYLSQNNFLLEIDESFSHITISSFQKNFSSIKKNAENDLKQLQEIICSSLYEKYKKAINKAFLNNSDPLAKIEIIEESLKGVKSLYKSKYPSSGENEFQSLQQFLFTFFPPSNFYSGLSYMNLFHKCSSSDSNPPIVVYNMNCYFDLQLHNIKNKMLLEQRKIISS